MKRIRKLAAGFFEITMYGLGALSAVLATVHPGLSRLAAVGAGGSKLVSRAVDKNPPPGPPQCSHA